MKNDKETEIRQTVHLLINTFGHVEAARIIRLLQGPQKVRDYTAERHKLLAHLTNDVIFARVLKRESAKTKTKKERKRIVA
jgi:hypothetical protein